MDLTLELFVTDLGRSRRFYLDVLGFEIEKKESGGYTRLRRGLALIALNDLKRIPASHPSRQEPGETVGRGFELGLAVQDIDTIYSAVRAAGGQIAEPLKTRPWGARDFCLQDPDGNYLRISSS